MTLLRFSIAVWTVAHALRDADLSPLRAERRQHQERRQQQWRRGRERAESAHSARIESEAAAAQRRPRRPLLAGGCVAGADAEAAGGAAGGAALCAWAGLTVALAEGEGVQACRGCRDVQQHGAVHLDAWEGAFCPPGFRVAGAEAVFAVPNDMAGDELLNAVGGAALVAFRGGSSLSHKARVAQVAGAVALIVIDHGVRAEGGCSERFECGGWLGDRDYGADAGPGGEAAEGTEGAEGAEGGGVERWAVSADGSLGGGAAAGAAPLRHRLMGVRDDAAAWRGVRIPVVLLTRGQGERLQRLMADETATVEVDGVTHKYIP